MTAAIVVVVVIAFLLVLFLISAIKVAREYERGIVFRLGRLLPEPKGPGLFLLIPIVDRMVRVDLRTITLNIPPQEVITKDNVPVRVNAILQGIIDEQTAPWGIKVSIVEVKDVEIPQGMQRAMARQAEAERERRAKIINAEGEYQAAERLKDASLVIEEQPVALQLRYLQTLLELGSSQSTTIVFPAPIDLIRPFLEKNSGGSPRTKKHPGGG